MCAVDLPMGVSGGWGTVDSGFRRNDAGRGRSCRWCSGLFCSDFSCGSACSRLCFV